MGNEFTDLELDVAAPRRRTLVYGATSPAQQTVLDRDPVAQLRRSHLDNIALLESKRAERLSRTLKNALPASQEADPELIALRPIKYWLRNHAVPIDKFGRTALIAVADTKATDDLRADLRDWFHEIITVQMPAASIESLLLRPCRAELSRAASRSLAPSLSCRSFDYMRARYIAVIATGVAAFLLALAPAFAFGSLLATTMLSLLMFTILRASGLKASAAFRPPAIPQPPTSLVSSDLPMISVLVPLYKEAEIGRHLLRRLCKLTYPRDRLEVILVLEAEDHVTREAVKCAQLPNWFRLVEVPADAAVKTKPRAMNYALNFCRGEIIGIWDAEDAPLYDQLEHVAHMFETAPPDVACLQGVLDFYNARHNWISRCFALEYAGWFRVVLQGIARLGLVVPLGGTTVFLRRSTLEQLGAWDAHNVTEDADLGVRIARAGLRTEMLPTTTYEEANSRVIPWIKQRSRWLKGFMVTYLVHMRQPSQLLAELGWVRFLGFQAFFLGSIGQFLLAPLLWSFWLIAFGFPHPGDGLVPPILLSLGVLVLLAFETLNFCIWIMGARASGRTSLSIWAPVMPLYFTMGCFAAYKALAELFFAPFFWDKTSHGKHSLPDRNPATSPHFFRRRPASDES